MIDLADLWRNGGFNQFELAGEFNKVFGEDFTGETVKPNEVSFTSQGVYIGMEYTEKAEWVGSIIKDGEEVECLEGITDYGEVGAFLTIAKELWDTTLRPTAPDWIDEGGTTTSVTGRFIEAERWAYRLTRTPLVVFYADPIGWCVGSGRNPRQASEAIIHGPWKDMADAKRFAENWVTLDGEWKAKFQKSSGIVDIVCKDSKSTCYKRGDRFYCGPDSRQRAAQTLEGEDFVTASDPISAIRLWEAKLRRNAAATRI